MICMDEVLFYSILTIICGIILVVLLPFLIIGLSNLWEKIDNSLDEHSTPLTDEEKKRIEYDRRMDEEREEQRKHREKMEEMERQRLKAEEERTSYEKYLAKKAHDDSIRHEGYDWTGGGDYKL